MRYIHRERANRVELRRKCWRRRRGRKYPQARSELLHITQHRHSTKHTLSTVQRKNTRIPNPRYTVQLTLLHTNKTRTCSLGERTNHNGTHFHRFLCRRGSNRTFLSSMCAILCSAVCALCSAPLCCAVTCCCYCYSFYASFVVYL